MASISMIIIDSIFSGYGEYTIYGLMHVPECHDVTKLDPAIFIILGGNQWKLNCKNLFKCILLYA